MASWKDAEERGQDHLEKVFGSQHTPDLGRMKQFNRKRLFLLWIPDKVSGAKPANSVAKAQGVEPCCV